MFAGPGGWNPGKDDEPNFDPAEALTEAVQEYVLGSDDLAHRAMIAGPWRDAIGTPRCVSLDTVLLARMLYRLDVAATLEPRLECERFASQWLIYTFAAVGSGEN